MSDNNPWGNGGGKKPGNPWGGGSGGNGPGNTPPDIDEMIRRAQENFQQVMPGGMSPFKIFSFAILVILGLWLVSGFYVVNPGEQAVIQRFGAWSRTQAEPGLGYRLPFPIETVSVINVEEIRVMSIGFNAPSQSRFGYGANSSRVDLLEESLMLTSDRNIVDLDLVIQWNIKSAEDYLFEIRDQENTIKKVSESAIREVVGQTNMFNVITTGRAVVAERAQQIIQANLDLYNSGVNIKQVLIQKAEVHPEVQNAFQDVQSAKQDGENVQNEAQAYREDIIPRARGKAIQMKQEAEAYKESTVARANGDAQRFEDIYTAYLSGKDVTRERLFIETMESVMKNAQKIIMDKNASNNVVPYLPLSQAKEPAVQSRPIR